MKIKYLFAFISFFPLFMITGCATIFSGSTQSINVQAVNSNNNELIPSSHCTITDGKGRTYVVPSNPGSVIVSKGQGALNVRCVKSGFKQTQVGVGQNFNAWTVANVLFWPGVIVDAATGAAQKYPSHITVLMKPVQKKLLDGKPTKKSKS